MLLQEDIAEEYSCDNLNIRVLTPDGFRKVLKVYKTVPLSMVRIETYNYSMKCATKHLLRCIVNGSRMWKHADELTTDMQLSTVSGDEKIVAITPLEEKEECYDLTIDHQQGMYYTDGILSHNSTTFVARQMCMSHLIPGYRSLYVAPHNQHLVTYANRYAEMESMFRKSVGKQLKCYKKYGKSVVDLIYCDETSLNARGKTTDEVLIDEAQSMDPELIEDILYTQTTSKMPMTIYAGTALSVDTLLEAMWQDSSLGVWHVRAGDGRTWLNMYDKDTLFKVCSHPQGPTCPITGKLLDVTNGLYVHGNKDAYDNGRIGIHVPQCIIPALVYDPIQWGKIYTKVTRTDEKKVMQECFGIAVAEGSKEISERDLMRLCTLQDSVEQTKEKCRRGYYRLIVSGCDWGGSDYNQATKTKTSYTVHCIIGLAPDGTTDILHYRRYAGMDYPDITNNIMQDHKAYGARAIATDFGVGMAYNMEVRKYVPMQQHYIMGYVGPQSAPLAAPKSAHLPNQLSLNRTEALTTVFTDVKNLAQQKIRAKNWGETQSYLKDWLNLSRVPVDSDNGPTRFRYIRNATKADDALHAFTFAYVLVKFFLGEPLVKDPSLERQLRDTLGGGAGHVDEPPMLIDPSSLTQWG